MDSCGRGTEYRHGKTFEECNQLAENFTTQLKPKFDEDGKLAWSVLFETVNHDELVYKLTLKYLRRDGYEIGNSNNPEIKKLDKVT